MTKMSDLPSRIYKDGEIVIEDGIPIPLSEKSESKPLYQAAAKMKVGQSILIPAQRAGVAANLARATGHKFTQRTFSRGPNAGMMRIWRTE